MNSDAIQKPGLILDKILMKFYEQKDEDYRFPTESSEIIITSNKDFFENIKNVDLLTYLKYPSVTDLIQWNLKRDDPGSNITILTMITKDCQFESLYNILSDGKPTSTDKKLTSTDKIIILYGTSKAICYFQSKFVVHNQLNLKNVFISRVDKERFPKIQNFHKSEVFYNPNKIELNMFSRDLESFRKLVVEILQESEISEDVDNQVLCEKLDALKIDEEYINSFKKFIESKKDPVTTMREFVKGIETKKIWLKNIDEKAFSSYKQSFLTADLQMQLDDSNAFDIVHECCNKSNENLFQMIEKLIEKSSLDDYTDFILGICYLKGIGIPQNFGLGYYYISRAEKSCPEAKALKLILEQKATVLESNETSTTLYQKGQILECQNKYREAYATYIKSIEKSIDENKSYIPSFGRIGRFLLNQANDNVEIEMKGIDYLKVGYENDDPYATFELYIYFEYKKNADISQQIAEKFGIIHEDEILTNASDLSQYFWKKAKLLGLPVEKMQTNIYDSS